MREGDEEHKSKQPDLMPMRLGLAFECDRQPRRLTDVLKQTAGQYHNDLRRVRPITACDSHMRKLIGFETPRTGRIRLEQVCVLLRDRLLLAAVRVEYSS